MGTPSVELPQQSRMTGAEDIVARRAVNAAVVSSAVGILMGIGMLTKLTILFLGFALFVSLWLVPQRSWYRRPWIWLAGVIALLCAIPYMLWQRSHDWYFLSYAASYAGRTTHASPVLDFLWNQLLPNNPVMFPVWAIGLVMLLFRREWKGYRVFGYAYLVLCLALFFLGGQFRLSRPVELGYISILGKVAQLLGVTPGEAEEYRNVGFDRAGRLEVFVAFGLDAGILDDDGSVSVLH